MKYAAFYILTAFIGIAVFGFSGLTTTDSLFTKCVEATIPGGLPCELHVTILPLLKSQIYLGFSLGLLAVILSWLVGLVLMKRSINSANNFSYIIYDSQLVPENAINKIFRWGTLHQQHPGH